MNAKNIDPRRVVGTRSNGIEVGKIISELSTSEQMERERILANMLEGLEDPQIDYDSEIPYSADDLDDLVEALLRERLIDISPIAKYLISSPFSRVGGSCAYVLGEAAYRHGPGYDPQILDALSSATEVTLEKGLRAAQSCLHGLRECARHGPILEADPNLWRALSLAEDMANSDNYPSFLVENLLETLYVNHGESFLSHLRNKLQERQSDTSFDWAVKYFLAEKEIDLILETAPGSLDPILERFEEALQKSINSEEVMFFSWWLEEIARRQEENKDPRILDAFLKRAQASIPLGTDASYCALHDLQRLSTDSTDYDSRIVDLAWSVLSQAEKENEEIMYTLAVETVLEMLKKYTDESSLARYYSTLKGNDYLKDLVSQFINENCKS